MKAPAPDMEERCRWEAWRPVSTIMRTNVPRVSADCSRAALLVICAGLGVESALVVDPEGKAMGVVFPEKLPPGAATAADALESFPFTLHESIPISLAAALMASAGIDEVPIVSSAQDAVGLLSSIEIMAWIARQAGHRVVGACERSRSKPDANEPRTR